MSRPSHDPFRGASPRRDRGEPDTLLGVVEPPTEGDTGDEPDPQADDTPDTADETAAADELPSRSELGRMRKDELVALAEQRGVSSDGTKDEIVDRLRPE